ncbi:hypothetical protein IW261DRAFT_1423619 [Armillaria novae-zelandiae]|uniref:Uncharacterized protein n=1 Tax=Armillaria novae-zelandiae TaxID=153914 RepID=A0AA39NXI8_9AGAR|nr:hypothetical protein IW261DRAFT_1423619 [Armillaria novae-zelandiae]
MISSSINYNDANAPPPPYTPRQDGLATTPDPVASIDSLLDSFRTLHHEQNLPQNSKRIRLVHGHGITVFCDTFEEISGVVASPEPKWAEPIIHSRMILQFNGKGSLEGAHRIKG